MTSIKARKFAQYYELVKFIIGPKVLVIVPFRFYVQIYISNLFSDLVQDFSTLFGQDGVFIFKIT